MFNEQLTSLVRTMLHPIASEADLDHLDPHVSSRDQFAFDSVDYLQFVLYFRSQSHAVRRGRSLPQG